MIFVTLRWAGALVSIAGEAGPGTPIISEFQDLAQVGYQQEEFFISGMAHSYTPS